MNEKVYIRFSTPQSNSETQTDGKFQRLIRKAIIKVAENIFPVANPDFEKLIERVAYWELEYDLKENAAWREIGFDSQDNMIMAMPLGVNYGYWTDNHLTLDDFNDFNPIKVEAADFENNWDQFKNKFED